MRFMNEFPTEVWLQSKHRMRSTPADAATIVIDEKHRWQPPVLPTISLFNRGGRLANFVPIPPVFH
jgi:hypothetical protein